MLVLWVTAMCNIAILCSSVLCVAVRANLSWVLSAVEGNSYQCVSGNNTSSSWARPNTQSECMITTGTCGGRNSDDDLDCLHGASTQLGIREGPVAQWLCSMTRHSSSMRPLAMQTLRETYRLTCICRSRNCDDGPGQPLLRTLVSSQW